MAPCDDTACALADRVATLLRTHPERTRAFVRDWSRQLLPTSPGGWHTLDDPTLPLWAVYGGPARRAVLEALWEHPTAPTDLVCLELWWRCGGPEPAVLERLRARPWQPADWGVLLAGWSDELLGVLWDPSRACGAPPPWPDPRHGLGRLLATQLLELDLPVPLEGLEPADVEDPLVLASLLTSTRRQGHPLAAALLAEWQRRAAGWGGRAFPLEDLGPDSLEALTESQLAAMAVGCRRGEFEQLVRDLATARDLVAPPPHPPGRASSLPPRVHRPWRRVLEGLLRRRVWPTAMAPTEAPWFCHLCERLAPDLVLPLRLLRWPLGGYDALDVEAVVQGLGRLPHGDRGPDVSAWLSLLLLHVGRGHSLLRPRPVRFETAEGEDPAVPLAQALDHLCPPAGGVPAWLGLADGNPEDCVQNGRVLLALLGAPQVRPWLGAVRLRAACAWLCARPKGERPGGAEVLRGLREDPSLRLAPGHPLEALLDCVLEDPGPDAGPWLAGLARRLGPSGPRRRSSDTALWTSRPPAPRTVCRSPNGSFT